MRVDLGRLRRMLRRGRIPTPVGRGLALVLVCAGLIAVGVGTSAAAGSPARATRVDSTLSPDSGPALHHDKSPPLRSIPPSHTPGKAHPAKPLPPGPAGLSHTSAPARSGLTSTKLAPTAGSNFDGLTNSSPNSCNCAPPDNEVAAGSTQVVELVNTAFAVYSKNGATLMSGK